MASSIQKEVKNLPVPAYKALTFRKKCLVCEANKLFVVMWVVDNTPPANPYYICASHTSNKHHAYQIVTLKLERLESVARIEARERRQRQEVTQDLLNAPNITSSGYIIPEQDESYGFAQPTISGSGMVTGIDMASDALRDWTLSNRPDPTPPGPVSNYHRAEPCQAVVTERENEISTMIQEEVDFLEVIYG